MKTYDNDEFKAEVLKRLGWTVEKYDDFLRKKTAKKLAERFTEEDLEFYVNKLKEIDNESFRLQKF